MNDDDFIAAFESCAILNTAFHHADHVRLARLFLQRHPPVKALERFTSGLKRFAAFHGTPGLYHETITLAYLFLIHERMAAQDSHESWESFAAGNPDLLRFKPGILERYYRPGTLESPLARRVFLLPDRLS